MQSKQPPARVSTEDAVAIINTNLNKVRSVEEDANPKTSSCLINQVYSVVVLARNTGCVGRIYFMSGSGGSRSLSVQVPLAAGPPSPHTSPESFYTSPAEPGRRTLRRWPCGRSISPWSSFRTRTSPGSCCLFVSHFLVIVWRRRSCAAHGGR